MGWLTANTLGAPAYLSISAVWRFIHAQIPVDGGDIKDDIATVVILLRIWNRVRYFPNLLNINIK